VDTLKRSLVWVLLVWMTLLTVWMVFLSVGAFDRAPASVAYAESSRRLDVRDPVVGRFETYSQGQRQEIMQPRTMPLWEYVQGGDRAVQDRLDAFEKAFEKDLHTKDTSFHLTHELIDGKEW
jgi:hypothetical protein